MALAKELAALKLCDKIFHIALLMSSGSYLIIHSFGNIFLSLYLVLYPGFLI